MTSLPGAGAFACRYAWRPALVRDQLLTGFKTARFEITQDVDHATGGAVIRWSAPSNAAIVSCAVFSCVPQVASADRGDGLSAREIANFDACTLASANFHPSDTFDLSNDPDPKSCDRDVADRPGCPGYVIDWLLVGCWASDGTRIVGASLLEAIEPSATYLRALYFRDCSKAADEGLACSFGLAGRTGTCVSGECMPRCQRASDCQFLIESAGTPSPSDAGAPDSSGASTDGDTNRDAAALDSGAPPCAFTCEAIQGRTDIGACKRASSSK